MDVRGRGIVVCGVPTRVCVMEGGTVDLWRHVVSDVGQEGQPTGGGGALS